MKWLGFILFLVSALVYIWNGKDSFSKKEWLSFLMKLLLVILGAFLLALLLSTLIDIFPAINKESARTLIVIIPGSLATVLLLKFLVVMMKLLFMRLMQFHQRFNTDENYNRLFMLARRFAPGLLVTVKLLASFSGILMLYGIWLGDPF